MNDDPRLCAQALEESPVARIVADANGVLAVANARARDLFGVGMQDLGRPLEDLEIFYRPVELRALIAQAYAERRPVTLTSVERHFAHGEIQLLEVVVTPLFENGQRPLGAAVSFIDVTRATQLGQELQRTHEEVQAANEILQTTNEELKASNEELEAMNEELQSTNAGLNAWLRSVLASLSAGAVVVDGNLDILMWNLRAEDLWGLRADEVRGEGLLNLNIGLPVAELRSVLHSCLAGEAVRQEVVLDAVNRRGKKIKCRVTCSPLVADSNQREGVILLMEEAPG